jgi:hypothetical protein
MKAAIKGLPQAQFNIGYMYAEGVGVKKDINQARIWYEKAATQDLKEAVLALNKLK